MAINKNTGLGLAQLASAPFTLGKVFVVTATSGANFQDIINLYTPDYAGVPRNFTTPTLALVECVTGRGDIIILAPDYTTALTAAELASADTKGVRVYGGEQTNTAAFVVTRPTAVLPATTHTGIFVATGTLKLTNLIGLVTTVIQTQACNVKVNTLVGSTSTDICADLNVSAHAVGSRYSITGTFVNALINTAVGVPVASQATSVVIPAGATIELTTSATNTGSVRWIARYEALDNGARLIAV